MSLPAGVVALGLLALGCGGASGGLAEPENGGTPESSAPIAVALRLEDGGVGEGDVPITRALLVLIDPDDGRTTTEVGEFPGICSAVQNPPRAIGFYVGASCWWQGRTIEVAVIERNQSLVAIARSEDGERELTRVAIPEHSHVYPVGNDDPTMPAAR